MKRFLSVMGGLVFAGLLLGYGVTQEVPVGTIEGKVTMAENGKPLPDAMVTFTPLSELDLDIIRPRYKRTADDGTFKLTDIPAGAYEMDVSAEHHDFKPKMFWIEEGKIQDLGDLKLEPAAPFLKLYASQRVFTPHETPGLELHGFTEANQIQVKVFQIGLGYLAQKGDLSSALYPLAQEHGLVDKIGKVIASSVHTVERRDAEGAFINNLKVPSLGEGFFLVQCSAGKLTESTFINVSSIAMVSKSAQGKALAFVTDIESGKPIAAAEVLSMRGGALAPIGKTDSDGLLSATYDNSSKPVLVARRGPSLAFLGFYGASDNNSNYHITTYTDRPIYRAGDEIHYKGIVRVGEGDQIQLPPPGSVEVQFKDSQSNLIGTQTVQLTDHGTYSGSFKTDPAIDPGDFSLNSSAFGTDQYLNVPISDYRKPEYSVKIESTQPYFILGQRASAKIKCEYYFGGPVAGAKVKATIYRSPLYGEGSSDFVGGEYSEEIEATTDANGEAILTFDTKAEGDPEDYPTDFEYDVVASVADTGDKFFDGEGTVKVVRGAFDLEVEAKSYVAKQGDNVSFALHAESHEGEPVANQKIAVKIGQELWTNRASYFDPTKTVEVVTDEKGDATLSTVADRTGTLKVIATAKDAAGNRVVGEASAWISGSGAEWYPALGDFKLTLDKDDYLPGETATILLQAAKPGGSALITVEADRVLWQKVVPIDSSSVTLTLPVTTAYEPNASINAAYIRDKKFFTASKDLQINLRRHKLKVTVTPSKEDYLPGETASVKIKTTDQEGNPEAANLSLAVVDESIYAIRSDSTDLMEALYPQRWNAVTTSYSFPEVYLDGGDKGGPDLRLRTKFRDTAYWQPNVNTDAQGEATLSFALPDNLTEWRATAIGITDKSAVGMSDANFKARKPLMVRLQPPSYLTQYDEQAMSVVVTNDTGKDEDVNLSVSADGVDLDGKPTQRLRVAAGKAESVAFTLRAPSSGTATLTAKAWITAGANDGVQQTLDIKPFGREMVETHAGEINATGGTTVTVLPNAAPSVGDLQVSVSPSLAGGLVQSLPMLIDYPYGCVEQTMSRFMPAVVVSQALAQMNVPMPAGIRDRLPDVVRQSYRRLASMQHYDGGWGWWEYGDVDPFMTALVLDGVAKAKEAGRPPQFIDMKKAVQAAVVLAKTPPKNEYEKASWNRDRVYLAYVLTKYGEGAVSARILKSLDLSKIGSSEAALAAMTAHALGDEASQQAAMARLIDQVQQGPTTANWAAQEYAWGQEPTSLALSAFLEISPKDPLIPKVVRYLMLSRQGNNWTSTRDSSYAISALTGYLRLHPDEINAKGMPHQLRVNGKTYAMDRGADGGETATIPMKALERGPNPIRIDGPGHSFFTVQLTQFDTQKQLDAIPGPDFKIVRTYHLLEPQRVLDGTTRLLPSKARIDQAKSGDVVRVQLTITSNVPRAFMMIDDPVPSNFRITERADLDTSDWGWWWDKTVIRDERITFFARWLPAGESVITYNMRAESPGTSGALPTIMDNMYDPGQRASDQAVRVEVTR